jgi:hypothetical protein
VSIFKHTSKPSSRSWETESKLNPRDLTRACWESHYHLSSMCPLKALDLVRFPQKWCTPWTPPGWGWRTTVDLRSCVESNQSRSTKNSPSVPPAKSKMRTWVTKRLSTGLSMIGIEPVSCYLLKSVVSKIHPITPRWNTLTSPGRTTSSTRWRPCSITPLWPIIGIVPPYSY